MCVIYTVYIYVCFIVLPVYLAKVNLNNIYETSTTIEKLLHHTRKSHTVQMLKSK